MEVRLHKDVTAHIQVEVVPIGVETIESAALERRARERARRLMARRFVDTPPAGADAWREVWQDDRRYRPRPARFDWLFRFVRRMVGRANEPEAERQKNFNVVLIDLLADLRREIAALRSDLKADLAVVQGDVQRADEALAADVAKIRELIPVAARRNDALIAALDQKIESVAARLRDVTNPLVVTGAPPTLANDFLYRRLEDGLRGSEAEVRESIAPYVELAKTHAPLLDVGCGRGELLLACRDAGVDARGFDTNERSVADLRARGATSPSPASPSVSRRSRTAPSARSWRCTSSSTSRSTLLFALYRESARVLRAGGLLIDRDAERRGARRHGLRILARPHPPRPPPPRRPRPARPRAWLRGGGGAGDPSFPAGEPLRGRLAARRGAERRASSGGRTCG